MTTVQNNAETGLSAGTTITVANSDDGSAGNAFDAVTIGTNAAATYEAGAANGSLCHKFVTGATSTTSYVRWSTSLGIAVAVVGGRIYFKMDALPAATRAICFIHDLAVPTLDRASLVLLTSGALRLRNAAAGTVATTTTLFSTATWYRVEVKITGSTSGAWELHVYSLNSTTDLETSMSGTANFGGTIGSIDMGHGNNGANLFGLSLDGELWNDTGTLPGPESAGAAVQGAAALSTKLSLASSASSVQTASPSLADRVSLSSSGYAVRTASPSLSDSVSLSSSGRSVQTGAEGLSAKVSLTSGGVGVRTGATALSTSSGAASGGYAVSQGTTGLGFRENLDVAGYSIRTGAAELSGRLSVSIPFAVAVQGAVDLSSRFSLVASGYPVRRGAASFSVRLNLTAGVAFVTYNADATSIVDFDTATAIVDFESN